MYSICHVAKCENAEKKGRTCNPGSCGVTNDTCDICGRPLIHHKKKKPCSPPSKEKNY